MLLGKRPKMSHISKLSETLPKSGKRTKQTCNLLFRGGVGIKKWSWFFGFGVQSAIFWHLKTGTFGIGHTVLAIPPGMQRKEETAGMKEYILHACKNAHEQKRERLYHFTWQKEQGNLKT